LFTKYGIAIDIAIVSIVYQYRNHLCALCGYSVDMPIIHAYRIGIYGYGYMIYPWISTENLWISIWIWM